MLTAAKKMRNQHPSLPRAAMRMLLLLLLLKAVQCVQHTASC
jgi:hypothetical protein